MFTFGLLALSNQTRRSKVTPRHDTDTAAWATVGGTHVRAGWLCLRLHGWWWPPLPTLTCRRVHACARQYLQKLLQPVLQSCSVCWALLATRKGRYLHIVCECGCHGIALPRYSGTVLKAKTRINTQATNSVKFHGIERLIQLVTHTCSRYWCKWQRDTPRLLQYARRDLHITRAHTMHTFRPSASIRAIGGGCGVHVSSRGCSGRSL